MKTSFQTMTFTILFRVATQVLLLAWLVDIVYDHFAPEDWTHFTFWMSVLMVMIFHLVVSTLSTEFRNEDRS